MDNATTYPRIAKLSTLSYNAFDARMVFRSKLEFASKFHLQISYVLVDSSSTVSTYADKSVLIVKPVIQFQEDVLVAWMVRILWMGYAALMVRQYKVVFAVIDLQTILLRVEQLTLYRLNMASTALGLIWVSEYVWPVPDQGRLVNQEDAIELHSINRSINWTIINFCDN